MTLASLDSHTPNSSIVTGVIVIFVMISVLPVVGALQSSSKRPCANFVVFMDALAVVIFMFIRNWSNFRTLCAEENGGVPRRMMIRFGIFCILPLPIVTISYVDSFLSHWLATQAMTLG